MEILVKKLRSIGLEPVELGSRPLLRKYLKKQGYRITGSATAVKREEDEVLLVFRGERENIEQVVESKINTLVLAFNEYAERNAFPKEKVVFRTFTDTGLDEPHLLFIQHSRIPRTKLH